MRRIGGMSYHERSELVVCPACRLMVPWDAACNSCRTVLPARPVSQRSAEPPIDTSPAGRARYLRQVSAGMADIGIGPEAAARAAQRARDMADAEDQRIRTGQAPLRGGDTISRIGQAERLLAQLEEDWEAADEAMRAAELDAADVIEFGPSRSLTPDQRHRYVAALGARNRAADCAMRCDLARRELNELLAGFERATAVPRFSMSDFEGRLR